MSLWQEIEQKIIWDFKVGEEFKLNREGYAFVVDVYEGNPKLALYKIKRYSSESNPVKKQPPEEMLAKCVADQGGDMKRGGLFNINAGIEKWIREELMSGQ
ncbi:MAG: DVU0772 family protein [Bacillota bacterium]